MCLTCLQQICSRKLKEMHTIGSDISHPMLIIPKKYTTLETTIDTTRDDILIDVSVTALTSEGIEMCMYSGLCNIKNIDSNDTKLIQNRSTPVSHINDIGQIQVVEVNNQSIPLPTYSQSQVWIDPARSPYVSCNYGAESQPNCSVYHEANSSHISVEQNNTYMTKNVFNNLEPVSYSPAEEFDLTKCRQIEAGGINPQITSGDPNNYYDDDEFECGVFLSQLSEGNFNEKEAKDRDAMRYIGQQDDNDALKQLMSLDKQSSPKAQKKILLLDHDSHSGQTIQKIDIKNPMLKCITREVEQEEVVVSDSSHPNQKKYQCEKCKQIFVKLKEFNQHFVATRLRSSCINRIDVNSDEVKFVCTECGKSFKTDEKLELHCFGHGDPDLECEKCHKVFASKYILRTHRNIHCRKHRCGYCDKTYSEQVELSEHMIKCHMLYMCYCCDFITADNESLLQHNREHSKNIHHVQPVSRDCNNSSFVSTTPSPCPSNTPSLQHYTVCMQRPTKDENSVTAKIISNEVFLQHAKQTPKNKRYKKVCYVCSKVFARVSDLKRHLIEHIIRSTLAKNPVNGNGTLSIQCEVCQTETFSKIDQYKAHLRQHAELTLYQCTVCDKSFGDSSHFSKHKKIHGLRYFECDICQRKFNSKRMITRHIEYHNNNAPIPCSFCKKSFHFKSTLNRHIKCTHAPETGYKLRCRICHQYFKTLKVKWDHEWAIHNVRKMKVDCRLCTAKFRKYSELKIHCKQVHSVGIPPAAQLRKENDIQ